MINSHSSYINFQLYKLIEQKIRIYRLYTLLRGKIHDQKGCLSGSKVWFREICELWSTLSVVVNPLQMDSPPCDIYRLNSLLRSLGEPSPRTVIFMIVLSWGRVSPSYRLCMYYFLSIYFLSLISESCYHLNLPLTIKISLPLLTAPLLFESDLWFTSCPIDNTEYPVCLTVSFSLSLSRYPSLSFLTPIKSSSLHLVSLQSWVIIVYISLTGQPNLARPCVGVNWKMSVMSWSLLQEQWPTSLICVNFSNEAWYFLSLRIFGNWPHPCCYTYNVSANMFFDLLEIL